MLNVFQERNGYIAGRKRYTPVCSTEGLSYEHEMYAKGNMGFWNNLAVEIEGYCATNSIKHINMRRFAVSAAGQMRWRRFCRVSH